LRRLTEENFDPRMMSVGFSTGMTKRLLQAAACARKCLVGERGSVAVLIGVSMSALVGMVALGTEITFVIYKHREMQSAADSAALGSATALQKGYPTDYALEGKAIAATAGFVNGVDGVTITVNKPPASGNNTANAGAVEVIVVQPQTLNLVSMFSSAVFTLTTRAVALKGAGGNFCILTTDTTSATGMALSNGATINLNQCGAAVNSAGAAALSVIGGATLNALSVSVKGQTTVNNGGVINATNGVLINQAVTADPYAAVVMPTVPAGCTNTNKSVTTTPGAPLQPGTYCNGLSISNGATASLAAGVYYIKQGSFTVAGGSTLTGTGVTIILTKNASTYATATINNNANITLSAPTTGATAGILFFADRAAPTSLTTTFAGGATMKFTGALYFPTQRVAYSNGTTTTVTCTQLIAWRATFTGGAAFNNNCGSAGTRPIGGSTANRLVE
jgi:Putative Flp pilus-assembly TadE/G-like